MSRGCWEYGDLDLCGPERVALHLKDAARYFGQEDAIYHAKYRDSGGERDRVNKRISRDAGEFITVEREDGWLYVFASVRAVGEMPPELQELPPRQALSIFRWALRLPRLASVRSSRGWPLEGNKNPTGTGEWERLHAPISAATHRAAERRMRELYAARTEADWAAHLDDPPDYSPEEATALYLEALLDVRVSGKRNKKTP